MERTRVFMFWIPFAYLFSAAMASRAVRLQPKLTMAWSPQGFENAVGCMGGNNAAQVGLIIDVTFIALFAAIAPRAVWRTRAGRWWVVAIAAVVLDVAEDTLLFAMLSNGPTSFAAKILWFISALKLTAYLVVSARVVISKAGAADLRRWLKRLAA